MNFLQNSQVQLWIDNWDSADFEVLQSFCS